MSYGTVWVDLQGTSILPEEIPIIRHTNTAGVLLFTKNYQNKEQLQALVRSIRELAEKPLLIGVDHEGGRIWRFAEGFTCPPAAAVFGKLYDQEPDLALQQLQLAGRTVARELIDCGLDLTFAPVLDLDHGTSAVIGDRAYHSDPQVVIACAKAFISGLKHEGMGAIGKHFPGHGACRSDSHTDVSIDERNIAEISELDLVPFAKLHYKLSGIMPAHIIYTAVDTVPAGFSKIWLQEILRKQLGFQGAIISDCLSMRGSGFDQNLIVGAERALDAGCDMIIATQQTRPDLLQLLNGITWQMKPLQRERIQKLAVDLAYT